MTDHKKTICIDFDGVIHAYSKGWHDGTAYDDPVPGAFEAIKKLRSKGYNIVILSARPAHVMGQWFLDRWPQGYGDIPEVTNTKPIAIAYIDDRGIRFTNWKDILNYF